MRRAILAIATVAAIPASAFAEADRFDLSCHLVGKGGVIETTRIEQTFSVDVGKGQFCRLDINGACKLYPLVDRGRWLDFSYRYKAADEHWETYRLYDRETGWMHQVLRKVGDPGNSYGDLACTTLPFSDFRPTRP